ncbi:hypothetical protein SCLARK_001697 [Spiroplasma clarkii]|uniref:hypothetical protein n=1 Tax=Spiroplasma clarkii TaxID=2139 RepID=UPI000B582097|nr:hypothetical protein [Spiroplasma clarkii]ARU92159.1 hypothetical protein SCLARK_001697 [Spiroplasma clarkii]
MKKLYVFSKSKTVADFETLNDEVINLMVDYQKLLNDFKISKFSIDDNCNFSSFWRILLDLIENIIIAQLAFFGGVYSALIIWKNTLDSDLWKMKV